MTPNPLRGEASLLIDGAKRLLRPTFTALVAAEEELGPLFALVERVGAGQLRLAEMAALFWHCLAERTGSPATRWARRWPRRALRAAPRRCARCLHRSSRALEVR